MNVDSGFKPESFFYANGILYAATSDGVWTYSVPEETAPAATTTSANAIAVNINGSPLQMDVPPTIVDGRTLLPLRAIFEALGAQVQWNAADQTITATKGNITIVLTIGSTTAMKNGSTVILDVPPLIIDDRTLVPARFVSEAMGAQVNWDAANQTVDITTIGNLTNTNQSTSSNPSAINNKALFEWNGVKAGMTEDQVESVAGAPQQKPAGWEFYPQDKCGQIDVWWYSKDVAIYFTPDSNGDMAVAAIDLKATNDSLIARLHSSYDELISAYGQPTNIVNLNAGGLAHRVATYTTSYGNLIFYIDINNKVTQISIGNGLFSAISALPGAE